MFNFKKIIKNNSTLFFLFLTLNGFSQQPIISGVISSEKDSIKDVIVSSNTLGVFSITDYFKERRNSFVSKMADSLNIFNANRLPFWISQPDFDYIYGEFWENMHTPTCLRQLIFARITNKRSLQAIIKSKNKDYKRTSKMRFNLYGEHKIPFQDDSNTSLAKQQLKILINGNQFNFN